MTRSLNHPLDAGCKSTVRECAERHVFHRLCQLLRILQAAGAHPVPEADRDIIFREDLQQVIEF
jgi:hypothetical protein